MRFIFLYISLFLFSSVFSQSTVVNGVVRDTTTNERMSFVKVRFQNTGIGVLTDTSGIFRLQSSIATDTIEFVFVGYETKRVGIVLGQENEIEIWMAPTTTSLNTITVQGTENPAFPILRKVKEHKPDNNPEKLDAYQCEIYNKLQFDVNNLSENFEQKRVFKKMDFIMDYVDSLNGEKYLPFLLSESISDYYYKDDPSQQKEYIKATRVTGVDYMQVGQFTGDMYQNVNIYENSIELFAKDFVSPISDVGRAFYTYYLLANDTIDGVPCYHIQFVPKRKGVAVFDGEMWITDSSYAVKKIIAIIPDDVNLNYVSDFYVEQNYNEVSPGVWMLTDETMLANFDLINEAKDSPFIGATVHKNATRKDFIINEPKDFDFYVIDVEMADSAEIRDEKYWEQYRHVELNSEEAGVIAMVDSLKENKTFKFYDNLIYMAYSGVWRAGPLEIGNIYSFYNQNVVEGHRLMLSLGTSNRFSKRVGINSFLLYGFNDEVWKYGGSVRIKTSNTPREMLRFGYRKKIEQLGLSSSLGDIGNSFTTLFSAGPLDKLTMVNLGTVSFEKDWNFDMRTFNAVEWKKFVPLGSSDYSRVDLATGDTNQVSSLTSFEIRNQIMYTKDEKFISGQFDRLSLGSKHPIISLTHTWGLKGVMGSEFDFHRLDFVIDHRPKIGVFGRFHYTLYAGKIFGTVPYPFLNVHQGNETFYLQMSTFNLVNYYEFISDQWIGINVEHRLQGFIMDRVPLIRKLKLRLVYAAKMVIGSYDSRHNEEMLLPYYSYKLTSPYYEVSVGLENIFKFIRVDAIWRLSYRDNVNLYNEPVKNFGVKFTFTSDF